MRPGMIEKIVLLYVKGCVVQFRQLFKIRYSRAYDFRSIFHVSYTLICWKIYFFLVSFLSDNFQWAKVTFQKEFLAVLASGLSYVVSYTKKFSCTYKGVRTSHGANTPPKQKASSFFFLHDEFQSPYDIVNSWMYSICIILKYLCLLW